MKLEDEIKMPHFDSNFQRAYLNIIYTANTIENFLHIELKKFNITPSQFNVLRILRGQKGKAIAAHAIQERMLHQTSNVTRIIDKLVEKGLVTSEYSTENRRKVDVLITADGLALVNNTDETINGLFGKMSRAVTDEEANLLGNWLERVREEFRNFN
jgi:DNA-binding MarR family transcriptional regulator